jgi:hypothetical protein
VDEVEPVLWGGAGGSWVIVMAGVVPLPSSANTCPVMPPNKATTQKKHNIHEKGLLYFLLIIKTSILCIFYVLPIPNIFLKITQ